MAEDIGIGLLKSLRKADPEQRNDFVRHAVERLAQSIMEVEVDQEIGADRYERAQTRTNRRNGSQPRDWDTTAGTEHLQIPRLRQGSCMRVLPEPRRRADRALANVVTEAYVVGVGTRTVDTLIQAMGMRGMDKSTVSRLAGVLDDEVRAFREHPRPVCVAGRDVSQGARRWARGRHGLDDRRRADRRPPTHRSGRGVGVHRRRGARAVLVAFAACTRAIGLCITHICVGDRKTIGIDIGGEIQRGSGQDRRDRVR